MTTVASGPGTGNCRLAPVGRKMRVGSDQGQLVADDPPGRAARQPPHTLHRERPLPAQQPDDEHPAHQQRHLERTPPRRRAQHARRGTGQGG
ncbi:hypothetical protein KEF29_38580 [Streptomyces tuirus]|uniref:Uncharacterized protein n=1 Tax=Streptomyces tuirus TaxID=68278 RepID=A0A941FEM4_9ACTN|nr:hypothetical protein [Streptomyces tuirus]